MENVRLILDSSANEEEHRDAVKVVPLMLTVNGRDFIDDDQLDLGQLIQAMNENTEAGKTSCPSIDEWLSALSGSQRAIIITITSGLSGSYSSAYQAKQIYEQQNPGSRVIVVDSRSAGPELAIVVSKIKQWLRDSKLRFVDLEQKIADYQVHTHLLFVLQSLHNLALNGRVSGTVAKVAGALKINLLGRASQEGKLEPLAKIRGMKRTLKELVKSMEQAKYHGGKVIIDHCQNEKDANSLKEQIIAKYPNAEVIVRSMRGLCSFYAEAGGLMVGFED